MDDLISRKAAMDCCFKPQVRPNAEIFNALKMAISSEISALPSVPAVPLDKLCEWLERNAAGRWNGLEYTASGWKDELTKWMEGLDAAD